MKLQYASDLHLEFQENRSFLDANPLKPVGNILLLAGDIVPFALMDRYKSFFKYLSDHFEATYLIPGNHEYYNYFDIKTRCGSFDEKICNNVHIVNNKTVSIGDVSVICSTLWTKISPVNQWQIEHGMNDFHVIKSGRNRFSAEKYNQLYEQNIAYITDELTRLKSSKKVVVTHHVPTLKNYPDVYKGSVLNEAFAVELFNLIEHQQPDAWIYGHSHFNTPDFTIGKTGMLTNQLGYMMYGENSGFQTDKVICV